MAVSIDTGFGIPAVLAERLVDYVVERIRASREAHAAWIRVLDEGYIGIFVQLYNNPGDPDLGNLPRPLQHLAVAIGRPLRLYLGDRTVPPISLWQYTPEAQTLPSVTGSWLKLRPALSLPAKAAVEAPPADLPAKAVVEAPAADGKKKKTELEFHFLTRCFALATLLASSQMDADPSKTVCVPFKLVKLSNNEYGYEYLINSFPEDVLAQAADQLHTRDWCPHPPWS